MRKPTNLSTVCYRISKRRPRNFGKIRRSSCGSKSFDLLDSLLERVATGQTALRHARVASAPSARLGQRRFQQLTCIHARVRGNRQQYGGRLVQRRGKDGFRLRGETLGQRAQVLQVAVG